MKSLASLSRFVGNTFAAWVVLFAVLGFLLPDLFRQLTPWIVTLLGIIMFGMGLTISGRDFAEVLRRPVNVGVGVASQFLIMPLLAVALTMIIPMSPEVAAGVILGPMGVILAVPLTVVAQTLIKQLVVYPGDVANPLDAVAGAEALSDEAATPPTGS